MSGTKERETLCFCPQYGSQRATARNITMSYASTFLAALTNSLPQGLRDLVDKVGLPVVGLAGLAILLVFFLFGRRLFAGKKTVDSEAGLKEKLGDYPPPPGLPGARRLTVEGEPARLRLVVAAPVG